MVNVDIEFYQVTLYFSSGDPIISTIATCRGMIGVIGSLLTQLDSNLAEIRHRTDLCKIEINLLNPPNK